jgi:hypothetical protein
MKGQALEHGRVEREEGRGQQPFAAAVERELFAVIIDEAGMLEEAVGAQLGRIRRVDRRQPGLGAEQLAVDVVGLVVVELERGQTTRVFAFDERIDLQAGRHFGAGPGRKDDARARQHLAREADVAREVVVFARDIGLEDALEHQCDVSGLHGPADRAVDRSMDLAGCAIAHPAGDPLAHRLVHRLAQPARRSVGLYSGAAANRAGAARA